MEAAAAPVAGAAYPTRCAVGSAQPLKCCSESCSARALVCHPAASWLMCWSVGVQESARLLIAPRRSTGRRGLAGLCSCHSAEASSYASSSLPTTDHTPGLPHSGRSSHVANGRRDCAIQALGAGEEERSRNTIRNQRTLAVGAQQMERSRTLLGYALVRIHRITSECVQTFLFQGFSDYGCARTYKHDCYMPQIRLPSNLYEYIFRFSSATVLCTFHLWQALIRRAYIAASPPVRIQQPMRWISLSAVWPL